MGLGRIRRFDLPAEGNAGPRNQAVYWMEDQVVAMLFQAPTGPVTSAHAASLNNTRNLGTITNANRGPEHLPTHPTNKQY